MGNQSKLMPCPVRQWALTDSQHLLIKLNGLFLSEGLPEYVSAGLLDCWVEQYRQALAEHGLSSGDRLAVMSLNALDTVVLAIACWRSGVIFCPVNPAFPPEKLLAYFDTIGARVFFSPKKNVCGELRSLQLPEKVGEAQLPIDSVTVRS